MRSRPLRRLLALGALLLAGCGGEEYLFSSLSESQANDIIALLRANNISASKDDLGKQVFAVTVPTKNFPQAVQISYLWGFPVPETAELQNLFVPSGIVPTPMEERIRLASGLRDELTGTLGQIEGVTEARLHLSFANILGNDVASAIGGRSGELGINKAAVLIKYDPERVLLDSLLPKIRLLISDSVPNLRDDQVVVITEAQQPFSSAPIDPRLDAHYIGTIRIRYEDLGILAMIAAALSLTALLLATAIAFKLRSARRRRSGA